MTDPIQSIYGILDAGKLPPVDRVEYQLTKKQDIQPSVRKHTKKYGRPTVCYMAHEGSLVYIPRVK